MGEVPLVERTTRSLKKEGRILRWKLCSMEETRSTRKWWIENELRYQEILGELRRRRIPFSVALGIERRREE
jgi:hypothetical protein